MSLVCGGVLRGIVVYIAFDRSPGSSASKSTSEGKRSALEQHHVPPERRHRARRLTSRAPRSRCRYPEEGSGRRGIAATGCCAASHPQSRCDREWQCRVADPPRDAPITCLPSPPGG